MGMLVRVKYIDGGEERVSFAQLERREVTAQRTEEGDRVWVDGREVEWSEPVRTRRSDRPRFWGRTSAFLRMG